MRAVLRNKVTTAARQVRNDIMLLGSIRWHAKTSMTGHALVSRPKHADGWAYQVSEFPPGTGTAPIAAPARRDATSQHTAAWAVTATSPRAWSGRFRPVRPLRNVHARDGQGRDRQGLG